MLEQNVSTPCSTPNPILRAGDDSLAFRVGVSDDERRGDAPHQTPHAVKQTIAPLLAQLRNDGIGLQWHTELNIESFFTVADAFEADGLLMQAVDCLGDLRNKLTDLQHARNGSPNPRSLISTETDMLHYRDAHNLHVLDDRYITGAQPTAKGYRWLKSKGVTMVLNLRLADDHERTVVERLGMQYVHLPWPDEQAPSLDHIGQVLRTVNSADGKVFQHCLRGIGRDMTMAGCYLIAKHAVPADEVIAAGRRDAPRWENDQQRDDATNEPVQFKILHEFEATWNQQAHAGVDHPST